MTGQKENRTELLQQIKEEVVNFKDSPLYADRIKNGVFPVIGEGSHEARIMFVGEAPGRKEAETGRPFAGAAGRVLDELLTAIGIDRKDVYITNVVKDRPPNNRDPRPEEVILYSPFLDRQIEIIKPIVIVALGRHSMNYLMDKFQLGDSRSITKIHGQIYEAEVSYGKIKFIPMFHPAAVLYNPELRIELKKDFEILQNLAK